MFMNEDVIFQIPCRMLDNSPSDDFFVLRFLSLAALTDQDVIIHMYVLGFLVCTLFYIRTL
jgi:hypothetical protein